MAKVIGPLYSQEARGQIGRSIVFGQRRGQAVVRRYLVPRNPMTDNQIAVRNAFSATGIVTRRTRATDWTYSGQPMTFIEHLNTLLRVGEVWNSVFVRLMQGPGMAFYTASLALYMAQTEDVQNAWIAAAEVAVVGLPDYTRGTATIANGFMLFLAQRAIADSGYGDEFDATTPMTISAGG